MFASPLALMGWSRSSFHQIQSPHYPRAYIEATWRLLFDPPCECSHVSEERCTIVILSLIGLVMLTEVVLPVLRGRVRKLNLRLSLQFPPLRMVLGCQ